VPSRAATRCVVEPGPLAPAGGGSANPSAAAVVVIAAIVRVRARPQALTLRE
jgi:hypothetical protein